MSEQQKLSTGTTTLGIVCKDCVVIGSDRRVTAGNFIAAKDFRKTVAVSDSLVMTVAGTVSDVQLVTKHLRSELKIRKIRGGRDITLKEAANLISTWCYSMLRSSMAIGHYLLGGKDAVYDISPDGALKRHEDYVCSGSGSMFAIAVLETKYKEGLSEEEGIALGVQALETAMQRDSASGNGLDIYVIDKNGARLAVEKDLNRAITQS